MCRSLLAATVAALVLAVAPTLGAQARPDFSGRWTLVAERSTPAGTSAFGNAFTIEQTAGVLTMDAQVDRVRFSSGPAGSTMTSQPGGTVKTVFNTDGRDHPIDEMASADVASTGKMRLIRTYFASDRTTERTYRAAWASGQLIIMTHETISIGRAPGDPITVRRMIRRSLSLDKDGFLVADSLIVADPVPEDSFVGTRPEQPAPTPVRSVYLKAQ